MSSGSLRRLAWRLESPAGLVGMFALALAIRLAIAPYAGFYGDLRLFQQWAGRLADVGPRHFYVEGQFADYPPGYLYVLWVIGKLSATPSYLLLKLPAILADLGLAWVAGTFAARLAPASLKERWPVRALVVAAVLFNPAVIALSAVWGQVDAVPAVFILWSLFLLFTGPRSLQRDVGAFLLLAVAVAMKPQAGFVAPVMVYALYRNYLHRQSTSKQIDGALSIGVIGTLSLGLWAVSGLAFGLGPVSLYDFYKHSASVYPVTSANAFNLWGAVGFWRPDSGSNALEVAGISAQGFGILLLAAGIVFVLWRAHRAIESGSDQALVLTVAAAVVSVLAYTLLTRMHERYMFLSLACLSPLVFARPLRWALAVLSGLFVLNLWYPYAYFNSQWRVEDLRYEPWFGWLLGGFQTDTWQKTFWSAAVTAVAAALLWFGLNWASLVRRESAAAAPAPPRRVLEPGLDWRRLIESARALAQPVATTRAAVWGPIGIVALACVFGLIALRGETTSAVNLNDSAFHLQMVRWADGQIGEGRVPLDGWYPYLSLGSAQFHHYQSLPHTLTAYAAHATGASDQTTYLWILYVLLALWPIAVYWGARLLGWNRWTAAAAAAISPLIVSTPGYGYEHNSYTWQGYGVYSQLWAMWLLPLAWGLTWRAVSRGQHYAAAAAALALTIACHFITGYLAVLTVGVWVLVLGSGWFLRRVLRAAIAVGASLLVASWVLVPLIGDEKWTSQSEYYKGTFFNDSYGAGKVLGWLFTGKLFDAGRFPIVTVLFFVGLAVCAVRARESARARALLGAFALSLLLFFGRPTLGRVLDLLPGFGDVQIHRFIMGVHLAGILIAGVGLGWLLQTAYAVAGRLATDRLALKRLALVTGAVAVVACVGVLAPAWAERARYDDRGAGFIRAQRTYDATDGRDLDRLVAIVKARGGGRVYAGLRGNWGRDYRIDYVPVHAWLAARDVDAIGFTFRTIASLSTDVEAAFDETNLAQYQMFNVRYLILPSDRQPAVPAKLLASNGRHRLYEVQTSGYFQVVDRSQPIEENRKDIEVASRSWRMSDLAEQNVYPGVAYAGGDGPPATFPGTRPPDGSPGTVIAQSETLQDGVFTATVDATRTAVVLLKATFDPRWTVKVDGHSEQTAMMTPSLVGVVVPPGRHEVRFRYRPYQGYPILLGLGAITLLGLALYPRRERLTTRWKPVEEGFGLASPDSTEDAVPLGSENGHGPVRPHDPARDG